MIPVSISLGSATHETTSYVGAGYNDYLLIYNFNFPELEYRHYDHVFLLLSSD